MPPFFSGSVEPHFHWNTMKNDNSHKNISFPEYYLMHDIAYLSQILFLGFDFPAIFN